MNARSVSVIICTWNRAHLLDETLRTLARQELPQHVAVDVVVVDNNSSDTTRLVVERLQPGWPLGALVYLREPRQGKQFALNSGIAQSAGDILAFTDDDVVLPTNWLATALEAFEDPVLELLGGKTLVDWPDNRVPTWFQSEMLAVVAGVDVGDARRRPPPPDYAPSGSNMVARRRLFDRVGPFSETHFRHMDYEFGQRALRLGAIVEYDPKVVVRTAAPPQSLSKRYFRRWFFKLGIARAMRPPATAAPLLLGVPRWMWRQAVADAAAWTLTIARGRADAAFALELRLRDFQGQVAAVWHAKLRPGSHKAWVERWSQKPGGIFR